MFSPTEERVLKVLGKNTLKVSELADDYFKGKKKPYDPNAVISSAVLRINRKCRYHRLDWFINSCGLGRAGKTIWKDKVL